MLFLMTCSTCLTRKMSNLPLYRGTFLIKTESLISARLFNTFNRDGEGRWSSNLQELLNEKLRIYLSAFLLVLHDTDMIMM